ncbi:hypothetical protein R3P38DRAFT_3234368 [Favolaschia claudopus]|uniref:Uncharacterized protein n=1 Tax=Favolaschia claudopus TaxID=2862362 RepID=A0AAV9ZGX4_9AGAR
MSRPCQAGRMRLRGLRPQKKRGECLPKVNAKRRQHPEADRDTVTSILHKAKAEHEPAAMPGSGSSLLSQAKRESLGGMRPKSRKLTKGTSKVMFRAAAYNFDSLTSVSMLKGASKSSGKSTRPRSKTVDEPASNATFMVDGVVLLTAGLGDTFGLPDDSIPNKAEIQTLVNRGVTYYKPNGRGITISVNADHEEVVDLLSELLYFEEAGDIKFTDDEGNSVRLELVHIVRPNGHHLQAHYVQRQDERYIFLGESHPGCLSLSALGPIGIIVDSIAFMPPGEMVYLKEGETTSKGKGKSKSGKRLSSIAFHDDDSEDISGDDVDLGNDSVAKTRKRRNTYSAACAITVAPKSYVEDALPTIFNDSVAQEIQASGAAHSNNAAASSSGLPTEPIDLTGGTSRSPSPVIAPFMRHVTPEAQQEVDPTFSDPIDFQYSTAPRPLRKFFF